MQSKSLETSAVPFVCLLPRAPTRIRRTAGCADYETRPLPCLRGPASSTAWDCTKITLRLHEAWDLRACSDCGAPFSPCASQHRRCCSAATVGRWSWSASQWKRNAITRRRANTREISNIQRKATKRR